MSEENTRNNSTSSEEAGFNPRMPGTIAETDKEIAQTEEELEEARQEKKETERRKEEEGEKCDELKSQHAEKQEEFEYKGEELEKAQRVYDEEVSEKDRLKKAGQNIGAHLTNGDDEKARQALEVLLELGNENQQNNTLFKEELQEKGNILHSAAKNGCLTFTHNLLSRCPDISKKLIKQGVSDDSSYTPLHKAVQQPSEVFQELVGFVEKHRDEGLLQDPVSIFQHAITFDRKNETSRAEKIINLFKASPDKLDDERIAQIAVDKPEGAKNTNIVHAAINQSPVVLQLVNSLQTSQVIDDNSKQAYLINALKASIVKQYSNQAQQIFSSILEHSPQALAELDQGNRSIISFANSKGYADLANKFIDQLINSDKARDVIVQSQTNAQSKQTDTILGSYTQQLLEQGRVDQLKNVLEKVDDELLRNDCSYKTRDDLIYPYGLKDLVYDATKGERALDSNERSLLQFFEEKKIQCQSYSTAEENLCKDFDPSSTSSSPVHSHGAFSKDGPLSGAAAGGPQPEPEEQKGDQPGFN